VSPDRGTAPGPRDHVFTATLDEILDLVVVLEAGSPPGRRALEIGRRDPDLGPGIVVDGVRDLIRDVGAVVTQIVGIPTLAHQVPLDTERTSSSG
jgi:hypothetical protein